VQCVLRPIKKKKQTTSQRKKKKMKNFWKSLTLGASALALAISASMAQDSGALIDALVKKGVLSDQEAEEIRADLTRDFATTSAGKLNIASHITQLKLYGDARFRYEYDRQELGTLAGAADPSIRERNRNRFRLRVGAEYAFTDSFKAGIQLATGNAGNSANVDFGGVNGGAFGKSKSGNAVAGTNANDSLYIDLLYLTYEKSFGFDWLELTGGRQKLGHNITTGWTWDSDINPEGGLVKLGKFSFGDFAIASTHGAYIYGDVVDNNFAAASGGGEDTWMFINQVDFSYKINKDMALRLSPGFMNFMGSRQAAVAAGVPPTVTQNLAYDVRDINVFFINGEFKHMLPWELSGKAYAEYGVNISGGARATALSELSLLAPDVPDSGRNQFAVVGYQVGKGKGKGSWTVDGTLAYYEAASFDPYLVDSDWHGGGLNGMGFGIKAQYSFTDYLTGSVNWRRSSTIDEDSTIAGSGPAGVLAPGAPVDPDKTDLVQVDLVWKF
jgi:hypothetical protein